VQAVDFMLYCLGTSSVLVAAATSVRIVMNVWLPNKEKAHVTVPKRGDVPDPSTDDLTTRLHAFQAARYSSPIVRRQLSPDAGPPLRSPLSTLPRPAIRPVPKPAPPPLPRRPVPTDENKVVPLPLKMKKGEEPPKEGT